MSVLKKGTYLADWRGHKETGVMRTAMVRNGGRIIISTLFTCVSHNFCTLGDVGGKPPQIPGRGTLDVTPEMIDAAMRKATEGGLLPRHACRDERAVYRDIICLVLKAALETVDDSKERRRVLPARYVFSRQPECTVK